MLFSEDYTIQTSKGIVLYSSEMMNRYGIVNAFPAKSGGVSGDIYTSLNFTVSTGDRQDAVESNLKRFIEATGGRTDKTIGQHQVHGNRIRKVTADDGGYGMLPGMPAPDGDGMYTECPELSLMAFSADCPNILLYAPDRRIIGTVHAGWRGTALDITGGMLRRLQDEGCDPQNITAFLPPAIGACCFETDDDVPSALIRTYGEDIRPYIVEISPQRYRIDLQRVNAHAMINRGVKAERIVICPVCTCCHGEFFSHRRAGLRRGLGGSVIRMPL